MKATFASKEWCAADSGEGGVAVFFLEGGCGCRCSGRGSLVEGPDLQAVDVEVLPAGERLVAECGALVSGAAVQLGVQPQAKVTAVEKRQKKHGEEN